MRHDEVQVLDKGFVRLIDWMGEDLTVANAARVSFNKQSEFEYDDVSVIDIESRAVNRYKTNPRLKDRDKKLIKYLAEHNHWTPFAHVVISVHIKAPIPIRAQFAKHTVGLVMNEVSRRYVVDSPEFYVPDWRSKPTDGAKQGSSDFIRDETVHDLDSVYLEVIEKAKEAYEELLSRGVAPEQARFVIPQGTYTEWWWTGSLAAFARVVKLRADPHAQWEIREYAEAFEKLIEPLFPISWAALMNK